MPSHQTGHQSRSDTHLTIPLFSNEDGNLAKAAFITAIVLSPIAAIAGAGAIQRYFTQSQEVKTSAVSASMLIDADNFLSASFAAPGQLVQKDSCRLQNNDETGQAPDVCWGPAVTP